MESIVVPEKGEIMPPGTPSHITPEPSTHEPSMYYPRPSSERSQDVSHVLATTFRELYTRDVMGKSMVRNLTVSSDGSTDFHRRCMDQLKEAHEEHKKRLQECDMLEKHIIQARARATSADERALAHAANDTSTSKYLQLGLPHVSSNFRWCLDEETLKKHDLIVPSDFYPKHKSLVDGPKAPRTPHFSIPTISSSLHLIKGPVDDGYTSKEELQEFEELKLKEEDSMTTLSSDSGEITSSPPRTIIRPGKSKKTRDKDLKDRWRENMHHDQRVADRAGLARIEERHNFLKNPRFLPLTDPKASKLIVKEQPKQMVVRAGRKVSEYTSREEPVQIFMPRPEIVLFTEWTVGKVYEAVLELKNVSSVSRQLRLIPPVTSFFSVGLGKYPGVHGLVAPGMSAKYNIRFMPDSLADYEDFVTVMSQAEDPLKVSIKAQRNPPVLTMPSNLQCGHCLVGGTKITELVLKNNGGSGRFCILKKSSWPAANFKTVVSPGTLDLGVFHIRPAVFELLAGQSMVLEIVLSPSKSEKYAEDIVMVCDNCQLKHLTIEGEGQAAAVELVSVSDGGEDQTHLGEISDMTAEHLIRFPPLNPHSFFMRQILVHNSTNVEMPYTWHTLKPNLQTSLRPDQQNLLDRFEFYPDESPAFFIEPQQGCLQPNGIHEFVVTFAPHVEGKYHNVLHLVLSNIPETTASNKVQAHKETVHAAAMEGVVPHPTGKTASKAMELATTPAIPKKEVPARLNRPLSNGVMPGTKGGTHMREVIALEVELKGNSIPYSVLLHPPAVVIPGSVLEGTTVKRPLKIANYSLAPVQFKWSSETRPSIIEMEPPVGIIDPGDFIELEVSVTGSKPGQLSCDLQCKVEHLEDPLTLNIQAKIDGPHVVINNPSVDFGLVRLGQTVKEKVTFRNTTQLPALWKFFESEHFYGENTVRSSKLTVSPEYGELGPLGEAEATVTYKPEKTEKLFTVLDMEIKDGKSSHISVNALVQSPQACFLKCDVVFSEAFLSVPQVRTVTLFNQTLFPTKFKFGELCGKLTKTSHVTVYPVKGMLAPREKLEIQVTFVSHEEGEVTSLFLPCHIEEMEKPIILGFYANIKPLTVEYDTPDSESEDLLIKYENPVKTGRVATRKITFKNMTAIRAPWSAYVETFSAKSPAPPAFQLDFKSAKSRRAMLGRTPNLCDPMAKTSRQAHQGNCNMILSRKMGAAFTLKPSRGFLDPYQTQVIEVEAYSNMWGSYRDNVVCNIEGVSAKVIPVELDVVGCPLVFQVVAGQEDKTAVVRFGTHINNGPQVQRKMRINNTSPMDIRVDWTVYNLPEPTDNKLLDLNIWYGRAFPRLNSSGSEIPPYAEREKSDRHPLGSTPLIVDTPDSGSTEVSNITEKTVVCEDPGKVVNLLLQPHFGQKSNVPFSISPSQAVVPANGHVTVSALFSPVMEGEQSKEWKAFAHGFMTLDDPKLKQLPNEKLRRLDGYAVPPLHLEMTAMVRTGSLHIEKDDDEGDETGAIAFSTAFSDILQQNKAGEEAIQYRYFILRNNTEMPLNFKMSVTRPFFIAFSGQKSKKESQRGSELRVESSARNTLVPQANKRVKLGFRLSSLTMDVLQSQRVMHHVPGTELKKDSTTGAETVVFRDDLTITYSNATTQLLPIVAHVTIPALRLSCHSLDFGTCFVGQERCLQVKLENVGESNSQWDVTLRNECEASSDCFRVEPNDGLLEGHTTHLAKNKTLLSVYFTARSDQECMVTFIFRGLLGEIEQELVVRGVGSYDGMHEI